MSDTPNNTTVQLPSISVTRNSDSSLAKKNYDRQQSDQPLINNGNAGGNNRKLLSPDDPVVPRTRTTSNRSGASALSDTRTPVGWRPIIPDGGWGWVVVFGSFLIHVFADGFVYSFGIIMVELLATFDEGRAWTSWIVSTLVGLTLGCGPLASAITNRYGCRLTTMVGAVVASIGCAISVYATSVLYLLISVGFVMGTGFGLMYCPAIVIVTMYFEEKRAFATGIAVCGAGFGTMIFAPLSNYLIHEYTWRGAFLIYAGIILNCAVCGALFRPLEFEPIYEDEEEMLHDGNIKSEISSPDTLIEADFRLHDASPPDSPTKALSPRLVINDATLDAGSVPMMLESGNILGNAHEHYRMPNGYMVQLETIDSACSMSGRAFSCNDVTPTTAVENGTTETGQQLVQPGMARAISMLESNETEQIPRRPTFKPRTGTGNSTSSNHRRRGISESSGYLDVKDVFYPGSVSHIPTFNKSPDYYRSIHSLHDRTGSVLSTRHHSRRPSHSNHPMSMDTEDRESLSASSDAIDDFKRILMKMANLGLLKDSVFLLFVASNFLTSVGLNPPLIFLPDLGNELGIDERVSSLFISAFGIANTIGRVMFGYISDQPLPCRYGKNPAKNRLFIYNCLLTVCGLSTMLSVFANDAVSLMIYSAVFGLSLSAYVCLTSVLLVDLLGLEKLTNAFGLLLLFQGIASLIGAPIAGWIVDTWGSYDYSFLFSGLCLLVSGIMLYPISWMKPDFGVNTQPVISGHF